MAKVNLFCHAIIPVTMIYNYVVDRIRYGQLDKTQQT